MESLSGGFRDVLCWTQHGEKISVWRICFKLSWNHLTSSPWLCLKSKKRVPLENSRWFKVTFWFPINQVKGHLTTPKRSPAELPGMKFYYPSCLWASGSDRSLTPPAFEPRGVIEAWAEHLEVSGLPFSFKILLLTVLNLSPKIETQQSQALTWQKALAVNSSISISLHGSPHMGCCTARVEIHGCSALCIQVREGFQSE